MSQALLAGISRTTRPQSMVRRFLALDAVVTGTNGLAYLLASDALGDLLGMSPALLFELGLFLTAFAAGVAWLASRRQPPTRGVKFVVDANLLWALGSIVSLVGWIDPSTAGAVWILMQAGTVAGFAALQWAALRGATAP
ncbi:MULTISPECIES: hypothetical protein [Streptomyces]|uniref:Integral membrane protein n=1 Tax=Streptomyces solicathayae TaxID=3081768 RepID=A0ABZ0LNR0_9ACTN|nr:hypothetical protein [Streptomyces sp. HUAS YS2]WOX21114.1 hypothetical protein R2D22_06820 [Streptomyces sp. HUAS YS2]